jgi:hypothetical protein
MYLTAFAKQAAYLLDWASILEGNETFWREYVADERAPLSASRRTGIGPDCTACKGGLFLDIYTKKQVRRAQLLNACLPGCDPFTLHLNRHNVLQ